MFRLIRLALLLLLAFVFGVFYERENQRAICESNGGEWLRAQGCATTPPVTRGEDRG